MKTTSKRPLLQFRLSLLIVLTYGFAICLSRNLGGAMFLLLLLPILIWMVVSLLCYGIPKQVQKASRDNTYRADGTRSERRSTVEHSERERFRMNLYVFMTSISMASVWLVIILSNFDPPSMRISRFEIVFAVGCAWTVLSGLFMRTVYLRLVADFYQGIQNRNREYLESDIARMQEEHQVAC